MCAKAQFTLTKYHIVCELALCREICFAFLHCG